MASNGTLDLFELLQKESRTEGFPISGGLDFSRVDPQTLARHFEKYDQWLANGFSGEMDYLVRGRERRVRPDVHFEGARSIFCVALPYSAKPLGHSDPTAGPRYARYLRGQDYHKEIERMLKRVMARVTAQFSGALRYKICVDTSAVLERTWAELAGLGWIGKNKLLIHPKHGSYLFLAEVFLDQEIGHSPTPMPSYCGNCSNCLEACPTDAFDGEGLLDSRKCISYWTLEKRGPLNLSLEKKQKIGNWIAGCDICQEVCPFNFKPAKRTVGQDDDLAYSASWVDLLKELSTEYQEKVRFSALKRVKPREFKRNVALALRSSIDSRASWKSVLPHLERLSEAESDSELRSEWVQCVEKIRLFSKSHSVESNGNLL